LTAREIGTKIVPIPLIWIHVELARNMIVFNILNEPFEKRVRVRVMVFNATFNNISAITWRSVLLVEETGGSEENHRPIASH